MKPPISIFKVYGQSMEPTLKPGQKLVSFNWKPSFKKGNLVAIKFGGKKMVKRVQKARGLELFVIGDNLKHSTDSRSFGWIKKNQIIGKVILIVN